MPTLVIEQLQAATPGEYPHDRPHRLELSGPALPLVDLDWGAGTQRDNTRWHARSGKATPQLLGPEEGAATFNFDWRGRELAGTRYALLDGDPLATVDELERQLDTLRQQSVLVRVTFREQERLGFIRSWHPQEGMTSEYRGDLVIQWVQARGYKQRAFATRPDAQSVWAEVQQAWDAALAGLEQPMTTTRTVSDDIEAATRAMDAHLARFETIAIQGAESVEDVQDDARRVNRLLRSPARRTAKAVGEVLTAMAGTGATIAAALTDPVCETVQSDDPLTVMRGRMYRARLGRAGRRARDRAVLERPAFAALEQPGTLTVHEALSGETIWSLALLYYGDLRGADDISAANELHSTVLRAGQRVVVPRRADGR